MENNNEVNNNKNVNGGDKNSGIAVAGFVCGLIALIFAVLSFLIN